MTQKELADILHISNKVISKWELNQSEPDISSLKALANVFGVSINELLGHNEENSNQGQNVSFNERAFNFFKKNYLALIEYMICFFALVDICVGYSLLINDVPGYAGGILIGFSIAFVLLQLFITLVQNQGKTMKILKLICLILSFVFFVINFVFIFLIDDMGFKHFFIVSLVQSALMLVAISLNCLREYNVLHLETPIKLGKIVFVMLIVFVGIQCGFVIGNITTTSVAFADKKEAEIYIQETPQSLIFNYDQIKFYNIGDTVQLEYVYYPLDSRKDKVFLSSSDKDIISVSSDGLVTAINYGIAYVKIRCGDLIGSIPVEVRESFMDTSNAVEVFAGNTYQINFSAIDKLSNLSKLSNQLSFMVKNTAGKNVSDKLYIDDFQFIDDELIANVRVDVINALDNEYLNILVYDDYIDRYTFSATVLTKNVSYISFLNIKNGELVAGEITEPIQIEYYPSEAKSDFTYSIDNTEIAELTDDNRIYIKDLGTFTLTVTASNGKSSRSTITIDRFIDMAVSQVSNEGNGFGDKTLFKIFFSSDKTPYSRDVRLSSSGLTETNRYIEDGAVYIEVTQTKFSGEIRYFFYLNSNIRTNLTVYYGVNQFDMEIIANQEIALYNDSYPIKFKFKNSHHSQFEEGIVYHIRLTNPNVLQFRDYEGSEIDLAIKADEVLYVVPIQEGQCTIEVSNEYFYDSPGFRVLKISQLDLVDSSQQNLIASTDSRIFELELMVDSTYYDVLDAGIKMSCDEYYFTVTKEIRNINSVNKCFIIINVKKTFVGEKYITIATADDTLSLQINVTYQT